MPDSSPDSSVELRRAIVDLLWRQWTALGVAGQVSGGGSAAVDPEALLLCSTVFARHDARLFDEIADWLQQNGAWINLLRLARLQREHDLGDPDVLAALAEHLGQYSSHAKWRALAKFPPTVAPPAPLFPHLPAPRHPDEIFQRRGWLRAPLELRGLSRPIQPSQPASFLLKLRALFGLQSRAEVMAWLLAHDSGHPAQIARETGYFRGSVQNVLNELAASGLVLPTRVGREKHFAAPPERWRFLLTWEPSAGPRLFPRWFPWAAFFALLRRGHDLVTSPSFAGYSPDLQAIELHRVLDPCLARLTRDGYRPYHLSGCTAAEVMSRLQQLVIDSME